MIYMLVFVAFSFQLGLIAWRTLHNTPFLLAHMKCDPNLWRWWDRFLLWLHKRPLSFQSWEALTWVIVMNVLYFWIRPVGVNLLVFVLAIVAIGSSGYIRNAPMYPLILLVAIVHPIFLIPLVLVKEVGGWFGVGVLLWQGQFIEAGIYGAIAFLLYLVFRLGSKQDSVRREGSAPFFTPPFLLSVLRKRPLLVLRDLSVTGIIFLLYFWQVPLLFLWMAGPLLLFALPWESHLWFPLLIVSVGVI